MSEDDVQDLLPAERAGVSEHNFIAVIVLRVVDMEAEIVIAPPGKRTGGFANVLLGVVADAHGEQFHQLATEILVRAPAHNARFAVAAAEPGSAFTPIPGVDLDEILCVEEERQVQNDNCVSYRTLKLQIPPSPLRPHFVKSRVKVHVYADRSHAVFHGPRCIGRYDENGALKDAKNAA